MSSDIFIHNKLHRNGNKQRLSLDQYIATDKIGWYNDLGQTITKYDNNGKHLTYFWFDYDIKISNTYSLDNLKFNE